MTSGQDRVEFASPPPGIRLPLLLVAFVAIAMLAPAIFLGRIPAQTDLLTEFGPWAALPYQTHPIAGGGDSFFVFLPDRLFAIQEWKAGRLPLWNPYQTAGLPILGLQTANPLDPLIFLHWILPTGTALGVNYALLLFLAGAGMLLLLRELGIRSTPALAAGSIAFALNPYFLYWMELRVFLAGLAALPLALWAVERLATRGPSIRMSAVIGLGLGYGAVAGTLQTVALFLLVLVLRVAWLLAVGRSPQALTGTESSRGRGLLMAGAGILVGLMIAALPLIATTELLLNSTRVGDTAGYYASSNFLPWRVVALWFCPDVFGWPANNVDSPLFYFGRTIASSSGWGALGIVPLFLVLIAVARRAGPTRERIFWGALMFLPLLALFAMATPAGEWLRRTWPRLDHIDLLRGLVLVNLGGAVLAAFGMARLVELWQEPTRTGWARPLWLFLVFGVVAVSAGRIGMFPPNGPLRDVFPLFVTVGFLWVVGFMAAKQSRNSHWWAWLLPLFIAFELGKIHFQFNKFAPSGSDYPHRPMVGELQRLLGPPDYHRFVTPGAHRAFPPNTAALFHLSDVRGYSNLPLARFRTLMNCSEERVLANQTTVTVVNTPINRLLGVAYVLFYQDAPMPPEYFEPYPLTGAEPTGFYRRPDALPRTFLVHDGMVVPDESLFCEMFNHPNFDPGRMVMLPDTEGDLPKLKKTSKPETAVITRYESDEVRIDVQAEATALLILGDAWYPGWRATVDGVDTRIYPAYWGLRGVAVEAGTHEVVFRYRPDWLVPGIVLSLLAVVGALAGLFRSGGFTSRISRAPADSARQG